MKAQLAHKSGLICIVLAATFATAVATEGQERSLTSPELARLRGGVMDKKCGVDPNCTNLCQLNNPVTSCIGSTTDPGTCYNEVSSYPYPFNDKRCLVDAPGYTCTEGASTSACRFYFLCEWDYVNQCCTMRGNPTDCFAFPVSCSSPAPAPPNDP